MRIRILVVGNDYDSLVPDMEMLRDRDFAVYSCQDEAVFDMIEEVKPALVFVNPDTPGLSSTKVYHSLLDDMRFASIPVIYTLSEDDVYLVNRKRTAMRDKRNLICDNIVDGIKTALLDDAAFNKRKRVKIPRSYDFPSYASRA